MFNSSGFKIKIFHPTDGEHTKIALNIDVVFGSRSGGRLVTTLFSLLLFSFSPFSVFLIERVLGSRNLFIKSCLEGPITKG